MNLITPSGSWIWIRMERSQTLEQKNIGKFSSQILSIWHYSEMPKSERPTTGKYHNQNFQAFRFWTALNFLDPNRTRSVWLFWPNCPKRNLFIWILDILSSIFGQPYGHYFSDRNFHPKIELFGSDFRCCLNTEQSGFGPKLERPRTEPVRILNVDFASRMACWFHSTE